MSETRRWFKFYPMDFIDGTAELTLEEIGAYILMLSKQWKDGVIPKEPKLFAASIRRSPQVFSRLLKDNSTLLALKFNSFGDNLQNVRLEQERQDATAQADKSRMNGSKGGRPITQRVSSPKPYKEIEKEIDKEKDKDSDDSPSVVALELEDCFANHISKFTKRKRDQKLDAIVFDKMLRLDDRTPDQVRAVIAWLGSDGDRAKFWKPHILSPTKLRKRKDGVQYFDKLLTEQVNEMPKAQTNQTPRWKEAFDRIHHLNTMGKMSSETANMLRRELHNKLKTPVEVLDRLKDR